MRHMAAIDESWLREKHVVERLSTRKIAAIIGCSPSKVTDAIHNYDIPTSRRIYHVNETYFDTWSQDMAYVLGFTMADGCVRSDAPTLCYHLHGQDVAILEFIRQQLEAGSPVRLSRRGTARFSVTSRRMCNRLANLGVVPVKTGREQMPDVPVKFLPSYLRGVFDGDGSISVRPRSEGRTARQWGICSASYQFLIDLQRVCGFEGVGKVRTGHSASGRPIFNWHVQVKQDILKLASYMYSISGFRLSRKLEVFERL